MAWLTVGRETSSTGRLALLGLALAVHGLATILVASRRVPWAVVLPAAALVMVVAVAVPPQGSKDLWAYAMQGRIVSVHHANPYRHRPSEFRGDPALERVAPGWRDSRSPYGPVFGAVEAAGSFVTGGSALGARLFYQGLAAIAVLAVALALRRRPDGIVGVVFLVFNPAVVAAVNGGHNDVLVGAGICAAVLLADRRRILAAGVVIALVALIKITALVAVLAMAAWLLRRSGSRCAVRFSTVSATVFLAGYGLVGGVSALDPVRSASSRGSRAALLDWPRRLLIDSLITRGHSAQDSLVRSGNVLVVVAIGCVLAVIGVLVVRGATSGSSEAVVVGSVTTLVLLSPYVLPWYALWALPVAALTPRSRASVGAWVLGSALLVAYNEPPGVVPATELTGALSRLALPIALVMIVILLVADRRHAGEAVRSSIEPGGRETADA